MAKTAAEREAHLRQQPVKYHANGNVKFPVTYSQLLQECERLQRLFKAKKAKPTTDDN